MVREILKGLGKSGNLKINCCGRRTSDNINVLCSRGEKMYLLMR